MRTLVLPILIAACIGLPFVFSRGDSNPDITQEQTYRFGNQQNYGVPAQQASTIYGSSGQVPIAQMPAGGQFVSNQTVPPGIPTHFASSPIPPAMLNAPSGTVVFPGTANGPDLTAAPMEFLPTTQLAEIFRFDVYPNWVKNRWPRVSTAPTGPGLHGMRVALVTGTNQNDLHGSLTYHFDANQRLQRITFQGWTGDTARLVQLLAKSYDFQAQPTHFAGLYLAGNRWKKTGALIMRHPDVVRAENPNQQLAVVLEINNPDGSVSLSQTMEQRLVTAAGNR